MASRTLKLYGNAYANSGNVSLVVNINGTQLFSGTVSTINTVTPEKNVAEPVVLGSVTLEDSVTGETPVSVAVSGGDAFIVGFGEDGDPRAPTFWGVTGGQMKTAISMDGATPADIDMTAFSDDQQGEFHLLVKEGSTVDFNYNIYPVYVDMADGAADDGDPTT